MTGTGIAGGVDTGGAVESIDNQTGVVGETILAVMLLHIACLKLGIPGKRIGSLGDILMAPDIGKGENLQLIANYLPYFL